MKRTILIAISFLMVQISFSQTIKVGVYDFEKPKWYDEINVDLPKYIIAREEVLDYLRVYYGGDTGTEETWKYALKVWAIYGQRNTNFFPVYLAHCYKKGRMYKEAVKIYSNLYFMASTQDEADWYKCYIAYNVGECYEKLIDIDNASIWYQLSAKFNYLNSTDQAISYYANVSNKRLKSLIK